MNGAEGSHEGYFGADVVEPDEYSLAELAVMPDVLGALDVIDDVKKTLKQQNFSAADNLFGLMERSELCTRRYDKITHEPLDGWAFNRISDEGYMSVVFLQKIPDKSDTFRLIEKVAGSPANRQKGMIATPSLRNIYVMTPTQFYQDSTLSPTPDEWQLKELNSAEGLSDNEQSVLESAIACMRPDSIHNLTNIQGLLTRLTEELEEAGV